MTYLDRALENLESVADDTTFSEVTHHLITAMPKADKKTRLDLSIKLETLKVHYYSKMAESLALRWKNVARSYHEDAHYAFNRLMNLYSQLPEEEN